MSEQAQESAHHEREHFFGAAKVMSALTLLSRVFGMLRSTAIASLGATHLNDSFSWAWMVPNLFRRLFGEGALSSAFVPAFTETAEKDGFEAADRLLANIMGLLAVFLAILTLLIIAALQGWGLLAPQDSDRQFLIALTSIMAPYMVSVCLLALASGALTCRGHFAYPAAAPILVSLTTIVAAWFVAPHLTSDLAGQFKIIAASVLVAGVLQYAGALWMLRRHGFSIRPRLWPLEPRVRSIIKTMAPMALGLGMLQVNELLEKTIAWGLEATKDHSTFILLGHPFAMPLKEGVLVRLDAARNLYQFPMGVLTTALATAVFPLLSRYSLRNDMVSFRGSLNRALRLSSMEGIAAGVGLFVLAEPITSILYQYRKFTSGDSQQAAFILRMYVLGMWSYCSYQILVRAFYALKDNLTPLKVSCWLVGFELVLFVTLVWVPWLGAGAFGLVTAIMFTVNSSILFMKLRKRLGPFGGRNVIYSMARTGACCIVMAAGILGVEWLLGRASAWSASAVAGDSASAFVRMALGTLKWFFGRGFNFAVVLACVPVGGALFLAAAKLMRAPEVDEFLGSLRRRKQV